MRTTLVTGGAGFIGSHLVRALLARGDSVRVLDNFSTGRVENLAGVDGLLDIREGDVRDLSCVAEVVRGVETIFHHAAFISVIRSMEEPQTCFDVNVKGTLNLLEAAREASVKQVVLASSAAVYGESQDLPLREETALRVLSPYAASKLTNETYAGLYTRALCLPVVSLRYFNVYGPRQSSESDYAAVVPIFIRHLLDKQPPTIYGDGHQKRDFINVSDVVRANILAAESPQAAGKIFNICTGQGISLLDLIETLSEIILDGPVPLFAPPRAGDIYISLGDPTHAAQALGFRAQVSLAEGLAETSGWMRN